MEQEWMMSEADGDWLDEDELPRSARVLPLPRRWELSMAERMACHEAWLMMLARELEPFIHMREVRRGYHAYLKYGGWMSSGAGLHEAAGSAPFETHDFERYMLSRGALEGGVEDLGR